MESSPTLLLVDNGSLQPAATLTLRRLAASLSAALGSTVEPVSLLHSSAVPPDRLEGLPAEILEPALETRIRSGRGDFLIVPLFFGPSGALLDYLPKRVAALQRRHPNLTVRVAPPLVNAECPEDDRVAAILEERVRAVLPDRNAPPAVILVDHGSPARAVTAVRDLVAEQLRRRLAGSASSVIAASMERRPHPEYDFNEPLLARALAAAAVATSSPLIVALLFLSPGRHAGPGGDIATLCAAAETAHPGLKTILTDPIGNHPGLIPILVERVRQGLSTPPL